MLTARQKQLTCLLVLSLCLLGTAGASEADNPYYEKSAYINPCTTLFIEGSVTVDGQALVFPEDILPYSHFNIYYVPLRFTLNACGIEDDDILWDDGEITIQIGEDQFQTKVGSDEWTLNEGESIRMRNGHVSFFGGTVYLPKDTIDAWRVVLNPALATSDLTPEEGPASTPSLLDTLEIKAGYSTIGGRGASIFY